MKHFAGRPSGAGGSGGGGRLPSLNFSLNVPLFSKSPLDLPFLEEVAKNVDENQYST